MSGPFLALTTANGNPVLVNAALVRYVEQRKSGTRLIFDQIAGDGGSSWEIFEVMINVKESLEEIAEMLGTSPAKAK
jgi:hypothetical protein